VFIIAAMCLVRESYIVIGQAVPDFVSRTRWEMVFAILALSLLMSELLYLLLSKKN